MARALEAGAPIHSDEWLEVVTQGHSAKALRRLKRVMRLLPGSPRCKVCYNPFGGFGGGICRLAGFMPSKKNPQLCTLCCEKMPRGGAEVETAILFADIRDSTGLAERMGPAAYAELLNRFYRVATETLIGHDATVDKLIGDEVMAFFIPGFSGPDFKSKAIDAGRSLMRAFGYGGTEPPWLSVGVGIDVGSTFVGNIGGEHIVDFTALGDPVNTAQRIQAKAKPGELLVSEPAFAAVSEQFPGLVRNTIRLRGKSAKIGVYSLPIG
jgi:adenylate cyclase